ncbi:MAG: YciI family protein [Hyphomicrobiaceae bacterium]
MFVVFLRFADKSKAPAAMEAHNRWIASGFEDGAFLAVGSLQPAAGGAILATGLTREALDERIGNDPFVIEGVVKPEIFEVTTARTDPRLDFLKD